MTEKFISEPLKPVAATFDTARMAAGEPGLPNEFTWRGAAIRISKIRREWRETGPCRHGSGEQYVRKHWYEIEDERGRLMKIYFERQPRGKRAKALWYLLSMEEPA